MFQFILLKSTQVFTSCSAEKLNHLSFSPILCSRNLLFIPEEKEMWFLNRWKWIVTITLAQRWHVGTRNSHFDLMGSLRKWSSPLSGFLIAMLTNPNLSLYYGAMAEMTCVTEGKLRYTLLFKHLNLTASRLASLSSWTNSNAWFIPIRSTIHIFNRTLYIPTKC